MSIVILLFSISTISLYDNEDYNNPREILIKSTLINMKGVEAIVFKKIYHAAIAFTKKVKNSDNFIITFNKIRVSENVKEVLLIGVSHEYANVLSELPDQINVTKTKNNTYYTSAGCFKKHSMLYKFKVRFWNNNSDVTYKNANFVTKYASRNVEEDFAESFAAFVRIGHKIKKLYLTRNKKIIFFSQFPEAVKIRLELRKRIRTALHKATADGM